jgi:hypothetical protein
MRTSLLCIQCKDRSLEHVDSWISRNNGEDQQVLGDGQGVKEKDLGRPHQGGVQVQLDFDSTSDSRT